MHNIRERENVYNSRERDNVYKRRERDNVYKSRERESHFCVTCAVYCRVEPSGTKVFQHHFVFSDYVKNLFPLLIKTFKMDVGAMVY